MAKKESLTKTSLETLAKDIADKQVELQQVRFGKVGKTKNTKVAKSLRRDIARLHTELANR